MPKVSDRLLSEKAASDPDDSDYDVKAARSSPVKRTSKKPGKRSNGAGKGVKRKQRYKQDSASGEDDDDDGSDEESDADFSEAEHEKENSRVTEAGRPLRAVAAQRSAVYEESSDNSDADDADADADASQVEDNGDANSRDQDETKPQPPKRIIRLHLGAANLPDWQCNPAASSASVDDRTTRRSSRNLRNGDTFHVSLTDERPRSRKSDTTHTALTRHSRSGKTVPKTEPAADAALDGAIDELNDGDEGNTHEQDVQVPSSVKDDGAPTHDDEIVLKSNVQVDDEDDEDDEPVTAKARRLQNKRPAAVDDSPEPRQKRQRTGKQKTTDESDFDPADANDEGDEDMSADDRIASPEKIVVTDASDDNRRGRRSGRATRKGSDSSEHEDLDPDELLGELDELQQDSQRKRKSARRKNRVPDDEDVEVVRPRRTRSKQPNYLIPNMKDVLEMEQNDYAVSASQPRGGKRSQPYRSLFSIAGPFGGIGGPPPLLGGPDAGAAAGGADSDSSGDEDVPKPTRGIGSTVGMTPGALLGAAPQTHNADPAQGTSGGPANMGKVKDRKALADADPLGVDPTVNFEGVGGLDDHIDRLKEMVALPLLYPEIFLRMHVTPPRGVLFHGPPGTGKTLLARALASSVSSNGQKVTFYMRKGADALSKWVGEAERQLRLLFEEARKNQPSIIFFDEIDGLAPVRSSKQEQIHASIVATLLALMDGMDGRGQVIVIGATNRPDSVDPALRRPGRFDREFYFPLPTEKARRAIIDIHTKGWEPPLKLDFKDKLAELTKGYGGADLRALCTEAALNAVQGTYPQIYSSSKKLQIDPAKIKVLAKDFMLSVNKIVPSSERSASSGAAPLAKSVEPLLRQALADISARINQILPPKRRTNALEEAMYDDRDDEAGFEKETLWREFESARIFRPRLLIRGQQGMGQQYLAAALLNKFEGVHVSSFDLPNLLRDSTRSAEAAVIQLFEEVKRHKPSVVFIPNVDTWYATLQESVIRTFVGLLRSLSPTEPVLVMGMVETDGDDNELDPKMMRDLFGQASKNSFVLRGPGESALNEYFSNIITNIRRSPKDFPDPANRRKRVFEELPEAPLPVQKQQAPSKEEQKAQRQRDRHTLNLLKQFIQPIMDQIKLKYRKFRLPPIDESKLVDLFPPPDGEMELVSDLAEYRAEQENAQPYKISQDDKGVAGIIETATGKFFYNLEITSIELRLSNGYYMRPKDFTADIRRLAKDASKLGEPDRQLKAQEMLSNVEVDMMGLEYRDPAFAAECEAVYQRFEDQRKAPSVAAKPAGASGPVDSYSNAVQSYAPAFSDPFPQPGRSQSGPVAASSDSDATTQQQQQGVDAEMHDLSDSATMANVIARPRDLVIPESSQPYGTGYPGSAVKTSEQSDRTTGFNGEMPDFASIGPHGGSQLPDTQEPPGLSSPRTAPDMGARLANDILPLKTPARSGSMQPPPTADPAIPNSSSPRKTSDISSLLNDTGATAKTGGDSTSNPTTDDSTAKLMANSTSNPTSEPTSVPVAGGSESDQSKLDVPSEEPHAPLLLPSEIDLGALHKRIVSVALTSRLSVEECEQVTAGMMDCVWSTRGQWDRTSVLRLIEAQLDETVTDLRR